MRAHHSLAHLCAPGRDTLRLFAQTEQRGIGGPVNAPSAPLTGIEVEVENALVTHDEERYRPWRLTNDGSLRNNGIELLSTPIRTGVTLARYCAAYTDLRESFPWADTLRTSTHVHLDMRGLQLPDLVRIMGAYCLVEPFLYDYCGPLREENIYCIPFYRADTATDALITAVSNGEFNSFLANTCKYSGLFMGPLRTFGTIEFRMAPSFPNGECLGEWVGILHHLYRAALALDPGAAFAAIDEGNYTDLLRTLLHPAIHDNLPTVVEVADIIEEHKCDTRANSLFELFLPPRERAWVMPEMPVRQVVRSLQTFMPPEYEDEDDLSEEYRDEYDSDFRDEDEE